jgi:hypothetical protein
VIAHLVLLKPRPDLTADQRRAFAAAFERAVTVIPSVRSVQVGHRVRHGAGYESGMPDVADIVALLAFDDLEGLQTYLNHPAHAEVGRLFGTLLQSALVFDADLGGVERIAALA